MSALQQVLGLGLAPLPQRSASFGGSHALKRSISSSAKQQLLGRGAMLRVAAASKGFGKAAQQPAKKKVDEDGPAVPGQREERAKVVKFKGKRSMRGGPQSQAAQQYARGAAGAAAQPGFNVLQEGEGGAAERTDDLVEAIEFEQRLKQLKAEADAKKAEAARAAAATGGVLNTARQQEEEDIYANVQPLSKTLLARDDRGAAKEYEGAQFGPSQAGLAAAAVLLGAVFLITSGGGDIAPPSQPQAEMVQGAMGGRLGEEQRAEVEAQLAEVKGKLAADSGDLESLEAAAVLNIRLGNYAEAEQQLSQLATAQPTADPEVLRVLAEAQAAQGKMGAAAGSFRKAWEQGGRSSLEVLQGLAGALVADGKEAAAVKAVQEARAEGGSSGIGEAELQLLEAKTYAQWRGHVPDALAVYDRLIESRPEDFRAYLAKGLLLKEQGREGDATRYFIQAKYYAKENKALVEQIISARQAE